MPPAYDGPSLVNLLFELAHREGKARAARKGRGKPKKGIDLELIELFEQKMAVKSLSPEAAAQYVDEDLRSKSMRGVRTKRPAAALARTYYREKKKLAEHKALLAQISAKLTDK